MISEDMDMLGFIVVDSTADTVDDADGVTTLREAIIAANEDPDADLIIFADSIFEQTITLASPLPSISESLSIVGQQTVIDGGGSDVFLVSADDSEVNFSNLIIENALDAIEIDGDGNAVTIFNVTISEATGDSVEIDGDKNTIIFEQSSTINSGDDGISIDGDYNSLFVGRSTFVNSEEDEIDVDGDFTEIEIVASEFTTTRTGGQIIDQDGANLLVRNSTFTSNGGDGIDISDGQSGSGKVVIEGSLFEGFRNAIEIGETDPGSTVTVRDSGFADNTAAVFVESDATNPEIFIGSSDFVGNTTGIDNNSTNVTVTAGANIFDGEASAFVGLVDDLNNAFAPDEFQNGNGGNNRINGNNGDNFIDGLAGNDRINARGGDDAVLGGSGNDTLNGNGGDDVLAGQAGNDRVNGGSGNDNLSGGTGNDIINGGGGNDSLSGGDGMDRLRGNRGNDTLEGGAGDDVLEGLSGNNFITDLSGNDTIVGGTGNDTIHDGLGDDLINGGQGDDVITLSFGDDLIFGDDGADTFVAKHPNIGEDRLGGFTVEEGDLLDLRALGVSSAADALAIASMDGGSTVLDFGNGHSLTLINIDMASITDDFFVPEPEMMMMEEMLASATAIQLEML
ncbi:MAG: right-handed parallel beta-helix repeat-containing protein [Pseudomonadota bacterium]